MNSDPGAIKKAARVAGLWYLLWAITGMYTVMYIPSKIIVPGDAAATGKNMLAHEFLFKTGIINDLLGIVLTLVVIWALYRLLEPVSETQAKFMVALLLVLVPATFVMEAFSIASLMLFKGEVLKTFDLATRQDMAMFLLKVNDYATLVITAFWGLWLFPLSILVYRSRFLPRILGVWLAINGLAYLAQSFTGLLFPIYKDTVFKISIPAMLGELAFMLWLAIRGANVRHLNQRPPVPEAPIGT